MSDELVIGVFGDLHCGHDVGLTPPEYDTDPSAKASHTDVKRHAIRRAGWDWFVKELGGVGKIDCAIWGGDLVDGEGIKSGGTEDTEMPTQVDMAVDIVNMIGAKQNVFVRGTPYHCGDKKTTWEDMVCAQVKGDEIGDEGHYLAQGLNICAKHKIGNSTSPVSRFTALSNAMIKQMLWADTKQQPLADLILRFHIHRCSAVETPSNARAAWSCPALQGLGSNYARVADGLPLDYGFLVVKVKDKKHWGIESYIAPMTFQAAHVVELKKAI